MKRSVLNGLVAVFVGLLSAQIGRGQGTAYLSNLDQPSSGSVAVGNNSWIAAAFITGNNAGGYSLNSVQLGLVDATGNPSTFAVMIYSSVTGLGISPGGSLGTLTGSANPTAAGNYTYTASSDLSLSPSADYFIVVAGGTPVANGAYEWSLSGINSYNPGGGWAVFGGASSAVYKSSNGSTWNSLSMTFPQFAINATAAPEPGTLGLLVAGGLVVGLRRWNEKKRS